MTDDLNHAGHGVGAVEGAFGAMDDLDFVDVVESEIGEVEVPSGKVCRSAVDEHFSECGVATVNKDSGQAADRSSAGKTDAGLRREKVRKGDCLALVDFLAADEINRRGCAINLERLRICGDDDVGRERLEIKTKVKSAGFAGSEIENGVAGDEGRALEMNVIAAGRNGEEIGAVNAGNRRPDASVGVVFKLRDDFDVADAVAGKICEPSGKMRVRWIGLCLQGKAEYRNCDEKKGSTKKRRFHFVLRSLSRGS